MSVQIQRAPRAFRIAPKLQKALAPKAPPPPFTAGSRRDPPPENGHRYPKGRKTSAPSDDQLAEPRNRCHNHQASSKSQTERSREDGVFSWWCILAALIGGLVTRSYFQKTLKERLVVLNSKSSRSEPLSCIEGGPRSSSCYWPWWWFKWKDHEPRWCGVQGAGTGGVLSSSGVSRMFFFFQNLMLFASSNPVTSFQSPTPITLSMIILLASILIARKSQYRPISHIAKDGGNQYPCLLSIYVLLCFLLLPVLFLTDALHNVAWVRIEIRKCSSYTTTSVFCCLIRPSGKANPLVLMPQNGSTDLLSFNTLVVALLQGMSLQHQPILRMLSHPHNHKKTILISNGRCCHIRWLN